MSSFVSLLSFKNKLLGNKLLGEYAKEYNIKIDDLDKILGKYIEDNYEELKIESEENQIKNMKRIIDEKEFCDQQKKFK